MPVYRVRDTVTIERIFNVTADSEENAIATIMDLAALVEEGSNRDGVTVESRSEIDSTPWEVLP